MKSENSTVIYYDEGHQGHKTRNDDPCETAERLNLIKQTLETDIQADWKKPEIIDTEFLYTAHSKGMVRSLRKYSQFASEGDEIFTRYYKQGDHAHSTPIRRDTFIFALLSASCAVGAAYEIKNNSARLSIALSRPPGHHAGRDFYHGFCFLNNAAIAARTLRPYASKVAIFDFDIHHPDGTQDIFYRSGDVFLVSVHLDPRESFPGSGFPDETGEGRGRNMIRNIPVEMGASVENYKKRFMSAAKSVRDFMPDALIISAGFDAHRADFPPGGQSPTQLSDDDFGFIGREIGKLGVPSCVVIEGGYNLDHLSASVSAFFTELDNTLVKQRFISYER